MIGCAIIAGLGLVIAVEEAFRFFIVWQLLRPQKPTSLPKEP